MGFDMTRGMYISNILVRVCTFCSVAFWKNVNLHIDILEDSGEFNFKIKIQAREIVDWLVLLYFTSLRSKVKCENVTTTKRQSVETLVLM